VYNAAAGDEIRVAQGTYTGSGVQVEVVLVNRSVTMRGGYTTTDWYAHYPITQPTALDGEGARWVVNIQGDVTPTLEGLQLTDGAGLVHGGGIYALGAHPIISGCQIFGNAAPGRGGGGIYLEASDNAKVINNDIFGNTATNNGGAIFAYTSTNIALLDNRIFGNKANSSTGGGIYLSYCGSPVLTENRVSSNTAQSAGGIGLNASPTATLEHNAVFNNTCTGGTAGGIYVNGSWNVALEHNEVFSNTAASGAGMYLSQSPTATLTNNHVFRNVATGVDPEGGGGLRLFQSHSATLRDNAIYSNTAAAIGGGVYLDLSHGATLEDNVIFSNTASTGSGGGLYLDESHDATLEGSAVFDNVANQYGGGIYLYWSNNTALARNDIRCNAAQSHGGGLYATLSQGVALETNLVADNRIIGSGDGAGVFIMNWPVHFVHNTFARNSGGGGQGIYVFNHTMWLTNTILVSHTLGIEVTSGAGAVLTHTLWGTGTWRNHQDWKGPGTLVTGTTAANWWEDPGFADPESGDYHLRAGSAAIDRGVDTDVIIDIDGDSRQLDFAPDLGADEFMRHVYLPLVFRDF
jgi:parallel beta-helix repeat protein